MNVPRWTPETTPETTPEKLRKYSGRRAGETEEEHRKRRAASERARNMRLSKLTFVGRARCDDLEAPGRARC